MDIDSEEFKSVVESYLMREYQKGLLIGTQVASQIILDKINNALSSPGKTTLDDMKRLVKDISTFCAVSVSRTVNPDGTVSKSEDSTIQN